MSPSQPVSPVVVIGGGPVGLWTAIQLKKRQPRALITVYEKYPVYRRSHLLRLQPSSLRRSSCLTGSPAESDFYANLLGNRDGKGYKPVLVRTLDLEAALKRHAQALGVDIRYEAIKACGDIASFQPDCRTVIGADGAHSLVRREVFQDRLRFSKELQHIVELKYEVAGKTRPLGILTDHYKSIKLIPCNVFEHIGRERDSLTPVTLRFFVSKKIYDAIGEATFKSPVTINDYRAKLPDAFAQSINFYLTVRKELLGDAPLFSTMKLGKLTLSAYGTQSFAQRVNAVDWFLVGDAALGVPYFRSLNAGLLCASRLAQLCANAPDAVDAYNAYGTRRLWLEYARASVKNLGLKLYSSFIRTSALVPWQVNKWHDREIRHYMKQLYQDQPAG